MSQLPEEDSGWALSELPRDELAMGEGGPTANRQVGAQCSP